MEQRAALDSDSQPEEYKGTSPQIHQLLGEMKLSHDKGDTSDDQHTDPLAVHSSGNGGSARKKDPNLLGLLDDLNEGEEEFEEEPEADGMEDIEFNPLTGAGDKSDGGD